MKSSEQRFLVGCERSDCHDMAGPSRSWQGSAMAHTSRAREVGYLPVYGDGLCADSVESRFLTGRIDTRRRCRVAPIQPRPSCSPVLARRYRAARRHCLLRAAYHWPSTDNRCLPPGPGVPSKRKTGDPRFQHRLTRAEKESGSRCYNPDLSCAVRVLLPSCRLPGLLAVKYSTVL